MTALFYFVGLAIGLFIGWEASKLFGSTSRWVRANQEVYLVVGTSHK